MTTGESAGHVAAGTLLGATGFFGIGWMVLGIILFIVWVFSTRSDRVK